MALILLMTVGCSNVSALKPGTPRIVWGPVFTNAAQAISDLDRAGVFEDWGRRRITVQYQTIPAQFETR